MARRSYGWRKWTNKGLGEETLHFLCFAQKPEGSGSSWLSYGADVWHDIDEHLRTHHSLPSEATLASPPLTFYFSRSSEEKWRRKWFRRKRALSHPFWISRTNFSVRMSRDCSTTSTHNSTCLLVNMTIWRIRTKKVQARRADSLNLEDVSYSWLGCYS